MATSKRPHRAFPAEQDARGALAALESSGLTISAFAKLHELDPQRIGAWPQRFTARDPATFVPVVVRLERDEDRVALVIDEIGDARGFHQPA